MNKRLDHRALYRLPWSLPDNAIAWLEPTSKCNLACEGCYRTNRPEHKSLDAVRRELDIFERLRTVDAVSIAGGDPLLHPRITDIVAMVRQRGWKPVLNTNGLALTQELLNELKRAGLVGVTFHVDSKQGRPQWKDRSEQDLNALRLEYAELVARTGGLSCAFNATVYEDTLGDLPDLVEWAGRHIDLVHVMVFICFRAAALDGQFDYYRGGDRVDMGPLAYSFPEERPPIDITSPVVVDTISRREPLFEPCAYLNGTERPDSLKWLLSLRLGRRGRTYGYLGPKTIELAQVANHLTKGRYLAYASPRMLRSGRSILGLWPFDRRLRSAARRVLFDPIRWFRRLHTQAIMIIQPIDVLDDGRQNMCDACPDMTVWGDRLAWSCRLEECLHFGQFVRSVPKPEADATVSAPPR